MTVPPVLGGVVKPGFEGVTRAFEENFAVLGDVGAAFAAYQDGELVVDLWGGLADPEHGTPWGRDSIVMVFSGTKAMVAVCLLILVERGLLDLHAPASRYWPELARRGKQSLLVEHLVSHRAGLPGVRVALTEEDLLSFEKMVGLLEDEQPFWGPGEEVCYHPLTYGWLCGEVIRRIDGRSVGRFFAEEVAVLLQLEAWIGLPEQLEPRVATLVHGSDWGTSGADVDARRDPLCEAVWNNPPERHDEPMLENTRACRAAEVPGANGIVTARSMARLFGSLACEGVIDGVRLLSPQTIQVGRRCLSRGRDPFTDEPLAFGVGFELQTELMTLGPVPNAFGHGGAGGSMHGAWPDHRVGFSYAMNELRATEPDPRTQALLLALYEAVIARQDA